MTDPRSLLRARKAKTRNTQRLTARGGLLCGCIERIQTWRKPGREGQWAQVIIDVRRGCPEHDSEAAR